MRNAMLLTLILAGITATYSVGHFEYEGQFGVSKWPKMFEGCAGKFQSPINIDEHQMISVYFPPLLFSGITDLPKSCNMTNNGHTVKLEMTTPQPMLMSGGPLTGTYIFRQYHFHWGKNDSVGSEDLINDESFSMELHVVFFKTEYLRFEEAVKHNDGVAVIALFFEATDNDNKVFSKIVDSLKKVTKVDTTVELDFVFPLEFILPEDRVHYYSYRGSLTTPPCNEVVTWIEFKQPVKISHRQVAQFRKLQSEHGLINHNLRPVQPINGRPIYYNVGEYYHAFDH